MTDPIRELKVRAELLHGALERGERLERLRSLHELRKASDGELAAAAATIRRKHCLAVVAREAGFDDWAHAHAVLGGEAVDDYGKALCHGASSAYWNVWVSSYDEAKRIRAEHGGYLLPYKRQFMIADPHYIESIGLDPYDGDWDLMQRDWTHPLAGRARRRLYGKLLRAQRSSTL